MNAEKIKHLYSRIGFGINPTELNAIKEKNKKQIVQTLIAESKKYSPLYINTPGSAQGSMMDDGNEKQKKKIRKINGDYISQYNLAWMERMDTIPNVLSEKMTLFWRNHFVANDKNNVESTMQMMNTLRKHALGNFGTFVKAISRDPAMISYLSLKKNKKSSPNENFARELMELFTLGQGNYTEKDIKESARAFTGYNYTENGAFFLKEKRHDYGQKTFFGKTGDFVGDDIIDIILSKKQCARFISEKIYRYFVNEKINKSHINQMTNVFFKDYDIANLMQFMLETDWFYAPENIGTKIKSPIELILGISKVVPFKFGDYEQNVRLQKLLGQNLFKPPNVAGWQMGKAWIDSNTLTLRLRLASILLKNNKFSYAENGDFKEEVLNFKKKKSMKKESMGTEVDWAEFKKNYQQVEGEELVDYLLQTPINSSVYSILKPFFSKSKNDLCLKIISLPEYQLC